MLVMGVIALILYSPNLGDATNHNVVRERKLTPPAPSDERGWELYSRAKMGDQSAYLEYTNYLNEKEGIGKSVPNFKLGNFKSPKKWANQFKKRGWDNKQVSDAISKGKQFKAENLVNKGNKATRYVHPKTGRSVVRDEVTKELIHVGGDGFGY